MESGESNNGWYLQLFIIYVKTSSDFRLTGICHIAAGCSELIQFRIINNSINSKQVRNFLLLGRNILLTLKMSFKLLKQDKIWLV